MHIMYNKPQQNTYKSNKDELSEGGRAIHVVIPKNREEKQNHD